jgi:hypothetical protein
MTTMVDDIWRTAVVEVSTPRRARYRGVCYIGTGGQVPWRGDLPRAARVTYETRLRVQANEAGEQARGRTIHHNLSIPEADA